MPVSDPSCRGEEYGDQAGDRHGENGRVPTCFFPLECPLSLGPRESVPITLAWRIPAGSTGPVAVDPGPSRLELP